MSGLRALGPASVDGAARPDLAALVSARLCHDLISPIGAIGNGVELMQLDPGGASAELDLVAGSLASALAKLRFFRLAFGPADREGPMRGEEAAGLVEAMFAGRFRVAWPAPGEALPRGRARLVALALLCVERSLPLGGAARVASDGETLVIEAEGQRVAAPEALWAEARGGPRAPGLRADGVQFALLARALEGEGMGLEARFSETGIALRVAPERFEPA